ncbi:MAG: 16S rRNA (cytosine(967)-C(5))-methyltransferase RsmB [Zoogloea sp.]|nr:16S rRNA (cytosine(967)-C(5))-methyltransferase RsmB [Zoogloea sp.]
MQTHSKRPNSVPPLREDSLAYALMTAAEMMAAVVEGRTLTDALAKLWASRPALPQGARGAIQDLAYGSLRDFGRGDFLLGKLLQKPLAEPVQSLLRVALHRLSVRPEQAYMIVDQAVCAAATISDGRYKGVVNGVLRNAQRQAEPLEKQMAADDEAHWRHPAWWIQRVRRLYPDDWQSVLENGNNHPPMGLRVNRRRWSVDQALAALAEEGLAASARDNGAIILAQPVPVSRLPGFADGRLSVQDAAAQWAAGWLDVADGQRVLDACSAPGGKTAHLLESADIDLLALDADAVRLKRVAENLDRLGLKANLKAADCRDLDAWWDGKPFDRILADVPCSASGVVRRHPDIKWLRRASDIAHFADQQAVILDALWRVLAPDGKMLYVTCSVFGQENSEQIERFVKRTVDCIRLPLGGRLDRQWLPSTEHDGLFYALLQKTA